MCVLICQPGRSEESKGNSMQQTETKLRRILRSAQDGKADAEAKKKDEAPQEPRPSKTVSLKQRLLVATVAAIAIATAAAAETATSAAAAAAAEAATAAAAEAAGALFL